FVTTKMRKWPFFQGISRQRCEGRLCPLLKPFQEIAFGLSPWLPEEAIVFGPALPEPWFHAIRPVGHTVRGNGIQHLLVEPAAACGITARPQRDHRPERFERLDRSLETDRPGFESVLAGGLCDDRAD